MSLDMSRLGEYEARDMFYEVYFVPLTPPDII